MGVAWHERRKHPRLAQNLDVRVFLKKRVRSEILKGSLLETGNISKAGLFLKTRHPHPLGASLNLEIQLDTHQDPIPVKGRVMWMSALKGRSITGRGMGIRSRVP